MRTDEPAGPVDAAIRAAAAELSQAAPKAPAEALPHLRAAQEHLTRAIDEAMAAAILQTGSTIRMAGALAGLSENAVGPRLARTSLLAAYDAGRGRVTASGVERARYDLEQGRHRVADEATGEPRPLRFRARRPT